MNRESGKIVAIIQARLGSTRLPLKSILNLRGLPLIDWVIRRVAKSKLVDEFIVAIPDTPLDKVLLEHLQKNDAPCMTGSENDVLARFARAAKLTNANTIVRICADNPLVSGQAIDELIEFYKSSPCDYAWNHIPLRNTWPDGLGAEIISAEILRKLDEKAILPPQREHCLNYIRDNASEFDLATFDPADPALARPDIRLDIDTPQDFCRLALMDIDPEMTCREIIEAWDRKHG